MIQATSLPITKAAKTLDVAPRSYYKWKQRKTPPDQDAELRTEIHKIALEFPSYGYRRIMRALRREGRIVNHKRVLRLMREERLLVRRKKKRPITTQSNHGLKKYPNLVKDLVLTTINQAWASDITYIRLLCEFVYLAVIIDLFSRRCIGWALSRSPDAKLTLDALNMAIRLRGESNIIGCVHHSDQGVQYAAHVYVQRLGETGMRPSMGEVGNSYENAFAESFIKTLKYEEVEMNEYETIEDVYKNIGKFIDKMYNKKRLHSNLGYKPPIEFENEVLNISTEA